MPKEPRLEFLRPHVRALLTRKRAEGLSKNSVRLIRATLSALLGDAVEEGLLSVNPALGVGRHRRKGPDTITVAERQQTIRPMSCEQLAAFLAEAARAVARQDLARREPVLFLTLTDTGLRPGEALALRWADLDLTGWTLRVERALSARQVKTTKTEGTRFVDVTLRLADALSQWQADLEAEALLVAREPSPWVFPSAAGTPLDAANVAKAFRFILRAAGLPRFRLYDLRHTFASHLLAEGAPITYVAAQLGHAKPTTTLLYYAHWLPRGDKHYVDRLAAAREAAAPMAPPGTTPEGASEILWHHYGTTATGTAEAAPEVVGKVGEPWRSRTSNLLIKSQLLCQLS